MMPRCTQQVHPTRQPRRRYLCSVPHLTATWSRWRMPLRNGSA